MSHNTAEMTGFHPFDTQDAVRRYADIIALSRPASAKYPPMPLAARAAQFAPFSALEGYNILISDAENLEEYLLPTLLPNTETLDEYLAFASKINNRKIPETGNRE